MARPFHWTPAKEQAFAWQWEGAKQYEMAARLGVTKRTIEGWTRRKAWRSRAETLRVARLAQMDAEWKAQLQRIADAHRAESAALLAADMAAIQAKYGRWAK